MIQGKILHEQIAVSYTNNYTNRPTIIFLHDSLGCIQLWRDFPTKLGELTKCNVFIYDRHGYGQSGSFIKPIREKNYLEIEADILFKIIEEFELKNSILFGHSDGGSIALIAAAKYSTKIKAIITEGAHIFVEKEAINGIQRAIDEYQSSSFKSRLEKYHGGKTDAMFKAWTETWTSNEFRSWNIESFLPFINCPSLIIQGEKDEFGTISHVDRIVDLIGGNASKLIIDGFGHTTHKEVPDIVLRKVAEFINSIVG